MIKRRLPALPTLALLLGLASVVGVGSPAGAHPVVVGSAPADGARVPEPLTEVRVRFSEPVTPLEVIVEGPSGGQLQAGAPQLEEEAVVQPLAPFQERGEHTVTYRLIAADDHLTEGSFTFRYTGPAEQASDRPREEPTPPASRPAEEASDQPGEAPTAQGRPAEPEGGQPTTAPPRNVWPLASTIALVALLAGLTGRALRAIADEDGSE